MINLELQIQSENSAFDEKPHNEIARILRLLADTIESGREGYLVLYDVNDNRAGKAFLEIWQD